MTQRKLVVDGLWHCSCLAFTFKALQKTLPRATRRSLFEIAPPYLRAVANNPRDSVKRLDAAWRFAKQKKRRPGASNGPEALHKVKANVARLQALPKVPSHGTNEDGNVTLHQQPRNAPEQITTPHLHAILRPPPDVPAQAINENLNALNQVAERPPENALAQDKTDDINQPYIQPSSSETLAQDRDYNHCSLDRDTSTAELHSLLRRYAARGHISRVNELVERLIRERHEQPNARLYEALILVNVNREEGSAARVAALQEELTEEGLMTDNGICHAALKVLAIHPDVLLRSRILDDMRQRWITLSESGWHDVATGYIKDAQVEQALECLDDMRRAGARVQGWLYDMVVYVLCDMSEVDEALRIMKDRISMGESNISASVWYYLFDAACEALHYDAIYLIWRRRVEPQYLNPSSGQCLQVLNACARAGDVQTATDVFRVLSTRSTNFSAHHYELLIRAYVATGDIKTCLAILCIMNGAGIRPSEASTLDIFHYLRASSPPRIHEAFCILQDLRKADRVIPTVALNCVIKACVTRIGLTEAIEQYKLLHTLCAKGPNAATFNHLLAGCIDAGRKDTAIFLASEMVALQVKPNGVTYEKLVAVCLQEEDYEDAFRYYGEMRGIGFVPKLGTFTAMVRRCGEKGDRRAWALLGTMKELGWDETGMRQWLMENWKGEMVDEQRVGALS